MGTWYWQWYAWYILPSKLMSSMQIFFFQEMKLRNITVCQQETIGIKMGMFSADGTLAITLLLIDSQSVC